MTPAPVEPMIAVRNLSVVLGTNPVLDDVTVHIARGESVGLVGPNGSGKTTLLRCLLGLVPFSGRASIDGHDVVLDPVGARSKVAWLPQKPAFGDATAFEVLAFVAKLRRLDRGAILPILEEVGLGAHARKRAKTFSGGMQQRLSLALALFVDAKVLLLDEPTASLDREGQERFLAAVGRLRGEGRTLLLASHRPEEIARLTDRVLRVGERTIAEIELPRPGSGSVVIALHPHEAPR
jgi:ABC-type multidrug transport system ATPase subunit